MLNMLIISVKILQICIITLGETRILLKLQVNLEMLLDTGEYVTKLHAICPHCGTLATHTYRLSDQKDTVVLGEKDIYEPRFVKGYSCRNSQ